MRFPVRLSRGLKVIVPVLFVAYGFESGERSLRKWIESAGCVLLLPISAAVHDLGHVLVVQRLGLTVKEVTLTAFGGVTHYEGSMPSPLSGGLIAFAGPLLSALFAAALLAAKLSVGGSEIDNSLASVLSFGVAANVLIVIVNLLPLPTLDGGRLISSIWATVTHRTGASEALPTEPQSRHQNSEIPEFSCREVMERRVAPPQGSAPTIRPCQESRSSLYRQGEVSK